MDRLPASHDRREGPLVDPVGACDHHRNDGHLSSPGEGERGPAEGRLDSEQGSLREDDRREPIGDCVASCAQQGAGRRRGPLGLDEDLA